MDAHEDAYHIVLRNNQSHEIRRKQASIIIEEPVEVEESSKSTNYKDFLLIKLFYSQLVF